MFQTEGDTKTVAAETENVRERKKVKSSGVDSDNFAVEVGLWKSAAGQTQHKTPYFRREFVSSSTGSGHVARSADGQP